MLEPAQYLFGILAGGLVGLTLGLFGGGGSMLTVPLMLYVVGVPNARVALGTSAVAVAANALLDLVNHARLGDIRWRCALTHSAAVLPVPLSAPPSASPFPAKICCCSLRC